MNRRAARSEPRIEVRNFQYGEKTGNGSYRNGRCLIQALADFAWRMAAYTSWASTDLGADRDRISGCHIYGKGTDRNQNQSVSPVENPTTLAVAREIAGPILVYPATLADPTHDLVIDFEQIENIEA